jgi:hypothetical protein
LLKKGLEKLVKMLIVRVAKGILLERHEHAARIIVEIPVG